MMNNRTSGKKSTRQLMLVALGASAAVLTQGAKFTLGPRQTNAEGGMARNRFAQGDQTLQQTEECKDDKIKNILENKQLGDHIKHTVYQAP
jgi:uncharacterized protein YycO